MMTRPRFRTLAHTADMRLAVWGASGAELVRNAVHGVVRIVLGRTPASGQERWHGVRRWPEELPHQLVRATNEALFQIYVRRQVPICVEVGSRGARFRLRSLPPAHVLGIEVKAATFHDLRPRRRGRRLEAVLTLDL
jgi:SHS2 domain-containing protein